ncbi:hypothetical protein [Legionella sp. W05-934-2]|jgi:hypothetical protein|uniref:hypothetical protein n=1 Tax=Legionella sp. W05-934-2 TaxID=1198649 RepID=UPI0034624CB6
MNEIDGFRDPARVKRGFENMQVLSGAENHKVEALAMRHARSESSTEITGNETAASAANIGLFSTSASTEPSSARSLRFGS